MGLVGEVGGSITSLYLPSPHQTQLPQQKMQLQEACMRKEKSVGLLEHQLLEVEVRDSSQQSPGTRGPGWGSPGKCSFLSAPPGDGASVQGGSGGTTGQDAFVPGCPGRLLGS